ncbi:head-tail connector protein [Sandaracinobacteroides saxicola]|nr:head-tail connector protein [Sandaracinobacteroides saxicola]
METVGAVPAVSLAEVKAFLRVTHDAEDALIAALARAATEAVEAWTGQLLIERSVSVDVAVTGPRLRFPLWPLVRVEAVSWLPRTGAAPGAVNGWSVAVDAAGASWVTHGLDVRDGLLRVGARVGLAKDWNGVPETARLAVCRLAAVGFARRDGGEGSAMPADVAAALLPLRRVAL